MRFDGGVRSVAVQISMLENGRSRLLAGGQIALALALLRFWSFLYEIVKNAGFIDS